MASSNIDEVIGFLDAFVHSIVMTRPGREGSLGKDLAMTVIRGPDAGTLGGIVGRCAQGVTPDGSPWPENDPEYAADKEREYGWAEVSRRSGQMLSQESLYGRTRIEAEQVTLVYGLDRPPDRSAAPTGHLSASDKHTKDTTKAIMRTNAGAGFYGINAEDAENVTHVAQENVNELIKDTNAANGV